MSTLGHVRTELEAGAPNAVSRMLGLLGDEWNLLIVQQSLLGATRFGEYLARLPISNAVLTTRLRGLTGEALLEQREYQANPPRTEYLLTPRGRALWPMMLLIWDWERRWVPDHVDQLPAMRHDTCGALFTPLLTCGACTAPSTDTDVKVRWGPSGSWERSTPTTVTRRRGGATGPPGLYPETMSVFGNRWSAAILIAAFLGASRFGDFQRQLGAPPASVSARLRAFVANTDHILPVRNELRMRIIEEFRTKGIEMPFDQRVVHMPKVEAMLEALLAGRNASGPLLEAASDAGKVVPLAEKETKAVS